MDDINSALKSCGIPASTRVVVSFYFKPEPISEIIRTMKGGETNVDPVQSQSAPSAC